MIIKGIRLRTSSGITRTILHVQSGEQNEHVLFLSGTPADIRDMHKDAVASGAKYSVRHWIIAPHEATTRPQMGQILKLLAEEFEFEPVRATVIEHRKKRASSDATDVHWHVLVGEVDPTSGRILESSYDRIKHELISRITEFTFGHPFVIGKHTGTVLKALRARDLDCIANHLEHIFNPSAAAPQEAFSHDQHQEKRRMGVDLPKIRREVKNAVEDSASRADLTEKLATLGLEARPGDKDGTWIVLSVAHGVVLGALHRLAGSRKDHINLLMEGSQSIERHSDASQIVAPEINPMLNDSNTILPIKDTTKTPAEVDPLWKSLCELQEMLDLDLNQPFPDFEPTDAMRSASQAVRKAQGDFSDISNQRTELQRRVFNTPRIRWWHQLLWQAKRRLAQRKKFEVALAEVEIEFGRKETALLIAQRRQVREELAAKEVHAAMVAEIARKMHHARLELPIVEEAKFVFEHRPDMAWKGLDFLLATARARVRRKQDVSGQIRKLGGA